MRHGPRKTTPKVRGGKVQRKNRSAETPNYYNTPQAVPAIDREKPGKGYRHLLRKRDIVDFISILPDWEELSIGLNAIILAAGEINTMGWHDNGIVAVCAWDRELWQEWDEGFVREHRPILEKLDVPIVFAGREDGCDYFDCRFTEPTAKAFQLMHVLLHELGHHHDRMTTRSKRQSSRGEGFAEQYANRYTDTLWQRYFEVFGY